MSHTGHGSCVSWVYWVMVHRGHGSIQCLVTRGIRQLSDGSHGAHVNWMLGHILHGSWVNSDGSHKSWVNWAMGHMGHVSIKHWVTWSWVCWAMGHTGHGCIEWWVKRVMGHERWPTVISDSTVTHCLMVEWKDFSYVVSFCACTTFSTVHND